ncbi:MAG: hypothetical protein QXR41_03065 [Nitrososphaerota archaeon]
MKQFNPIRDGFKTDTSVKTLYPHNKVLREFVEAKLKIKEKLISER